MRAFDPGYILQAARASTVDMEGQYAAGDCASSCALSSAGLVVHNSSQLGPSLGPSFRLKSGDKVRVLPSEDEGCAWTTQNFPFEMIFCSRTHPPSLMGTCTPDLVNRHIQTFGSPSTGSQWKYYASAQPCP